MDLGEKFPTPLLDCVHQWKSQLQKTIKLFKTNSYNLMRSMLLFGVICIVHMQHIHLSSKRSSCSNNGHLEPGHCELRTHTKLDFNPLILKCLALIFSLAFGLPIKGSWVCAPRSKLNKIGSYGHP